MKKKNLEKLSKVVDEVSKGNLNAQVEKTSSIKEINILADSLDRVLTTMKRSIKRMDDRNNRKEKKPAEDEGEEEEKNNEDKSEGDDSNRK